MPNFREIDPQGGCLHAHLSSSAKKKKSMKKIRRFSGTHTYLFKIWYVRAEISNLIGHVNNTLVCHASFLAADICVYVCTYIVC